jgi:hypothetical protein
MFLLYLKIVLNDFFAWNILLLNFFIFYLLNTYESIFNIKRKKHPLILKNAPHLWIALHLN